MPTQKMNLYKKKTSSIIVQNLYISQVLFKIFYRCKKILNNTFVVCLILKDYSHRGRCENSSNDAWFLYRNFIDISSFLVIQVISTAFPMELFTLKLDT